MRAPTLPQIRALFDRHLLREERLLARLGWQGKRLSRLSEGDLARDAATGITDQNHVGGWAFTEALARSAGLQPASRVLDLCSGLGGSARYLAWRFGCRVVGVEATPSRYRASLRLTRLVGMAERVSFRLADARHPPFPPRSFDVVWIQSALGHMAATRRILREWRRLLRAGGILACEDTFLRSRTVPSRERAALRAVSLGCRAVFPVLSDWLERLERSGFELLRSDTLPGALRDEARRKLRLSALQAGWRDAAAEARLWKRIERLARAGVLIYARTIARRRNSGVGLGHSPLWTGSNARALVSPGQGAGAGA